MNSSLYNRCKRLGPNEKRFVVDTVVKAYNRDPGIFTAVYDDFTCAGLYRILKDLDSWICPDDRPTYIDTMKKLWPSCLAKGSRGNSTQGRTEQQAWGSEPTATTTAPSTTRRRRRRRNESTDSNNSSNNVYNHMTHPHTGNMYTMPYMQGAALYPRHHERRHISGFENLARHNNATAKFRVFSVVSLC